MVEESVVREHAEAHARAVLEGDLRRAASDLAGDAKAEAGAVMKRLPSPITGVEVTEVRAEGEGCGARILYRGEHDETTVQTRWAERDGRPVIVGLEVP